MSNIQTVLFDLDGTLTNPEEGIINCVQYALNKMGKPLLEHSELKEYIGPPARIAFSNLLNSNDESQIETAISYYRERFSEKGIYENKIYDGIDDLLNHLKNKRISLYVATSKAKVYADIILKYFNIYQYFDHVYGPQLNGNYEDKKDLVEKIISENMCYPENTIIIGDRKYDIEAGKANRIKTCGVTYGFGSVEELTLAGSDQICFSVEELKGIIT
jgi:phosphoglycolate phosphatase